MRYLNLPGTRIRSALVAMYNSQLANWRTSPAGRPHPRGSHPFMNWDMEATCLDRRLQFFV
jgi:hypothetical protein